MRRLAAAASAIGVGRPLQVLVEIGYAGGRCGCRDTASALAVARAVGAGRPGLCLAGLEAFEGLNQSLPAAEAVERVAALLDDVVAAATAIDAEGLFGGDAVVLSAGVASYYDLVAARFAATRLSRPTAVVVRSGCYLTHDAGLYERQFEEVLNRSPEARAVDGRFQNALEVWAQVISVPEAGRAMLGAGRRDFGHDAGAPRPLKRFRPGRDTTPGAAPPGWEIAAINDQHAHMLVRPEDALAVGDLVALGVSHPCTTFDRWRLLFVVDDAYAVTSAIQTCF